MAAPFQRKAEKWMPKVRNYADYKAEYDQRMAPIRKKRLQDAKKRKHERKKDIRIPGIKNSWVAPVKYL